MTPNIELSNKGRITIWETGFSRADGTGIAYIIAGADGQKLQVIYDNKKGYLFTLDQVATHIAFVERRVLKSEQEEVMAYKVMLSKISSVTTEIVQGNAQLKPEITNLWLYQASMPVKTSVEDTVTTIVNACKASLDQDFYKEFYESLIDAAIKKASTITKYPRLFWGIPRKKE